MIPRIPVSVFLNTINGTEGEKEKSLLRETEDDLKLHIKFPDSTK